MTTTTAGGRISARIAGTFSATYAAATGDPVMVTGDYQVAKCDGTKPCIGYVVKRNVGRGTLAGGNAGMYPVSVVPGDVSVDLRGFAVRDFTSGAAITAGTVVGIGAGGTLVAAGAGVSSIGVALTGAAASGTAVDVLVGPTA